jgi:HlyD family secretion protein
MGKGKKSGGRVITAIVVILVILGVAYLAFKFLSGRSRANYTEVTARTGDITTYYNFSGTIAAISSQFVYANSSMQIDAIDVAEGQQVKKDEVLMRTTWGAEIKAPFAGTVEEIDTALDAQLAPGSKLCKIVDYNNLQLIVQVDEYDLSAVSVGKEATVTINAQGKDMTGTVTDLAEEGVSQNGVTYFNAAISLPSGGGLRVGMTAQARLLNQSSQSVILLPMTAIQFDNDNNPYVYVPGDKRSMRSVDVTLGINDGTNVEVKSGIQSGDVIALPSPELNTTAGLGLGSRRMPRTSSAASKPTLPGLTAAEARAEALEG